MKKIFILLAVFLMGNAKGFADEQADVQNFFNEFVEAANNYNTDYFKYYSNNAKIVRVVEKPDGTVQEVKIPIERYKIEAGKSKIIARIRKYKNKYLNIRISKQGDDYKISADRMPSTSSYKIPAHFVIGKDENGEWKIKEESMNTKMQIFLNQK